MERINSLEDFLTRGPSQLADTRFACPLCGREHTIPPASFIRKPADVNFDLEALSSAPLPALQAALGTVAAGACGSADWKLASLIHSSYFCPLPYLMTVDYRARCLSNASGLVEPGSPAPDALIALADAGQMAALAEAAAGSAGQASPLAGAAHVLSDYWDFQASARGLPRSPKGEQLGLAAVVVLALYETLRGMNPKDLEPAALLDRRPPLDTILAENAALYGPNAPQVEAATREKYLTDDQYLERVESILSRWDTLWKELEPYLSPAATVREPLRRAGLVPSSASIGREPRDMLEALLQGSRFSNRYTVLDLAWDLGAFPLAAESVLERAGLSNLL